MTELITAIKFVSGPLTLVAFALLVRIYGQRSREGHERELIDSAPPEQREQLIETALRGFRKSYENLTRSQKFELYSEEIRSQDRRHLQQLVLLFVLVVLGLIAFLATFMIVPWQTNEIASKITLATKPVSYATADWIPQGAEFTLILSGLPAGTKIAWTEPQCGRIGTHEGNNVVYIAENTGREQFTAKIQTHWMSIDKNVNFNIGPPF